MLYVGPILLRKLLQNSFFRSLPSICLAIKCLSFTKIDPETLNTADYFLKEFNATPGVLKGKKTISKDKFELFNVHAVRHLVAQTGIVGLLLACSSFPFESAHHHLVKSLTGTVNYGNLLTQRFIRKKLLQNEKMVSDSLESVVLSYTGF